MHELGKGEQNAEIRTEDDIAHGEGKVMGFA